MINICRKWCHLSRRELKFHAFQISVSRNIWRVSCIRLFVVSDKFSVPPSPVSYLIKFMVDNRATSFRVINKRLAEVNKGQIDLLSQYTTIVKPSHPIDQDATRSGRIKVDKTRLTLSAALCDWSAWNSPFLSRKFGDLLWLRNTKSGPQPLIYIALYKRKRYSERLTTPVTPEISELDEGYASVN